MNLKNKTVLITGASSGIGKALAFELASEGCKVILLARRINLLREIANEINKDKQKAFPFECDVSNKHAVRKAFENIKKEIKGIDIAILNAGVSHRTSAVTFNSENAEKTYGVNVMGIVYCLEHLLPYFIERNEGIIAGVSSIADTRGFPGNVFYPSSKSAVSFLLESLRVELKNYGIKVITVKPGFVDTPMTQKRKIKPLAISAKEAAKIIINGIKKEKTVIQFPFVTVMFMRVIRLMPNWLYDRMAVRFLGRGYED